MLNRAPYNTEVPEFVPSRDAPINSYITRKYPCQENISGKRNYFRSLTWKIQQPDAQMVWQSVKLVLPLKISAHLQDGSAANMRVVAKRPACNVALAESPMNAFRATTMTINGKIFSKDNQFRETLDTCYRGVGPQAYGDNHSLKPIVSRDLDTDVLPNTITVVDANGAPVVSAGSQHFVHTSSIQQRTVPSAFNLLEHNGPFIERARLFQDRLNHTGTEWAGDISHLLELGPFQARARKGNTAVPYIKDFHLRMNFDTNPSQYDIDIASVYHDSQSAEYIGRIMAPKLLEYATLPTFLHYNEQLHNANHWPSTYVFTWSAKPYLEITYTKYMNAMKPYYNLRCLEHQYEQSNRFLLQVSNAATTVSPHSLQRVTTRLNAIPTKVYIWGDVADEYKLPYISGGTRRSCLLGDIHCRINQRPDVMFNPSQEDCYEMFRRHTNSSLEYGSWLKSPIYCFDTVDFGQSDMFANDAKLTWMEWDADVSLTQLQIEELNHEHNDDLLLASGYEAPGARTANYFHAGMSSRYTAQGLQAYWDYRLTPAASSTAVNASITVVSVRAGDGNDMQLSYNDNDSLKHYNNVFTGAGSAVTTGDFEVTTNPIATQSYGGMIWAAIYMSDEGNAPATAKNKVRGNKFFWVPDSYRWVPTVKTAAPIHSGNINNMEFTWTLDVQNDTRVYTWTPPVSPVPMSGVFQSNAGPLMVSENGKQFGAVNTSAVWGPGRYAIEIDSDGIRNNSGPNAGYVRGGLNILGDGQAYMAVDEGNTTARWCCFGPMQGQYQASGPSAAGGTSNAWQVWRSTQATPAGQDSKNVTIPLTFQPRVAGQMTAFQYGHEQLHVRGTMHYGRYDRQIWQNGIMKAPGALYGFSMARQDFGVMSDVQKQYRLKVLYEYGNSQYQFAADATPTQVLPNLVPVN